MISYERRQITKDEERHIITGMIVSTEFLSAIRPIYKPELFTLRFARNVAKWCIEFYDKYETAPEADIKSLFEGNRLSIRNEEDHETIESFLENISDQYIEDGGSFKVNYEIDKAVQYFKKISLENLAERIKGFVLEGDTNKAESLIATYQRIECGLSTGVDITRNTEAAINAIRSDTDDILFKFPGDLGKLIRPIKDKDFVVFLGPAKRGKCATGSTEIILSDGRMKRLDDIVHEGYKEKVISLNENTGRFIIQKCSELYDNGKKPVYRVKTRTGREVTLTKNHPLLLFDGWKKLKDIKIGEKIAVPRKIDFFGDREINLSLVKVIAYLIADGGLTTYSPTFTKKKKEIMNDFKNCVNELGDKCSDASKSSNGITVCVSGGNIKRILKNNLNMKFCKSIYKEIPDEIFTLKKDQVKLFLSVLFTCDGSVSENKTGLSIDYSSGSEILIRQVQHLLLRFGVISTLRSRVVKGWRYYRLDIRHKEAIQIFLDEIGFLFHKNELSDKYISNKSTVRTGMSFIDCYPYEMKNILYKEIKLWREKNNISYKEACEYRCIDQFFSDKHRKCNVNRIIVSQINSVIKSQVLSNYLNSDVMWDEIVSVEYSGKENVYDLEMPTRHNFIANDFVIHNSYWLQESAIIGMMNNLDVLYISLEMPVNQMLLRIYQRLNGELEPSDNEHDEEGIIEIPSFDYNYDMNSIINFKKEYRQRISTRSVVKKMGSLQTLMRSKRFHLECFPAGSTSVMGGIIPLLDNLEHYEGFTPDLLVLDYADILKPESGKERRHQIDETWQSLRGLGQDRSIAVVTASHTNKATFDRDIRQSDLSEDNRKLNHVTLAIALNQSEDDEEKNIQRLSVIADRYKKVNKTREAVVLQCLDIGMPYLDSRISKKEG